MIYKNIKRNKKNIVEIQNRVVVSYVNGPRVEILGSQDAEYKVEFIDKKTNIVHYETELKTNHWAKANLQYFCDWKINVWNDGKLISEKNYDASNKRVYIALDSKALGDTLAWFPYVEEFGKIHNCKIKWKIIK